jgi:hypothetical protein
VIAISIAATLRKIRSLLRLRLINFAYGPRALGQKNDPHQRLDTLERVSGWGTLIILAGIALEIWMFFALDPHDPRERAGALIANCLIAVGLIMEYVAIRLTIVASGEAKAESDQKISEANARTATVSAETEQLRRDNLELEAQIQPRRLTPKQRSSIAAALKPFVGRRVVVASYTLDVDGGMLAKQIIETLVAAGLSVTDNTASSMPLGGFSIGIWVSGQDQILVSALLLLLNANGLAASPGEESKQLASMSTGRDTSGGSSAASLLVGAKPPPQANK